MASDQTNSAFSTPASKNMNSRVFSDSTKKQKKKNAKLLLGGFDGFQVKWPEIPTSVSDQIIALLIERFKELSFRILTTKEKKIIAKTDKTSADQVAADLLTVRKEAVQALGCELVFGINEVTKNLEKNILLLVVVDRSTKPYSMISHIPSLAASRGVSAVAVDGLTFRLANCVGVASLVALAFKKTSPSFSTVIAAIQSLIPPVNDQKHPKAVSGSRILTMERDEPLPSDPAADLASSSPVLPAAADVDIDISYKPLVIKHLTKDDGRAEKLKARQKRRSTKTGQQTPAVVKAPGKRKAKMVKLGKRHRGGKT